MFYLLLPLVLAKVELVDDKLLEAAKSFTDPKHAHLHPDLSLLIAMLLCVIAPICLALFETRVSGKQSQLNNLTNTVEEVGLSLNPDFDGKMVYVEGMVQPIGIFELSDSLLPFVTSKDAIEIRRTVERLQFTMSDEEDPQRKLAWLPHHEANGDAPQHFRNPAWAKEIYSDVIKSNGRIGLAPYEIESSWLSDISSHIPLNVEISERDKKEVQGNLDLHLSKNFDYINLTRSANQEHYEPGDYRIRYEYKQLSQQLSIIAQQNRNMLVAGKNDLLIVKSGVVSPAKMIQDEIEEGVGSKWEFRFLFLVVFVVGLSMIYSKYY